MIIISGPFLHGDGTPVTGRVRFHPLDLPGLVQGKAVINSDVVVTPNSLGAFTTPLAHGRWRVSFPNTTATIDIDIPESSGVTGQTETIAVADLLPLSILLGEGATGAGYRIRSGFLEVWNDDQQKFFPVYLSGAAGAEQLAIAHEDRNVLIGASVGATATMTVRANEGRLELLNNDQGAWQPVFLSGTVADNNLQFAIGDAVSGSLTNMPAQTVRVRSGIIELWSGDEEGWFPLSCVGASGSEQLNIGSKDSNA